MDERTRTLLAPLLRADPAAADAIAAAQEALDVTFPQAYVAYLEASNGGEGFIGDGGYLVLWPVDELAEINRDYEAAEMAPDHALIGSSGGGEAFALERGSSRIVTMPILPLDGRLAEPLADDFDGFVAALERQTDED